MWLASRGGKTAADSAHLDVHGVPVETSAHLQSAK